MAEENINVESSTITSMADLDIASVDTRVRFPDGAWTFPIPVRKQELVVLTR